MEILILLILFIGGSLTGLYASSVGSGGLITFPLLILTGLPIHVAIATNRLSAVILEFASALAFHGKKKINIKLGVLLGILAATGSLLGSSIVINIDTQNLNLIIAILFLAIILILAAKKKLGLSSKNISKTNKIVVVIFVFILGIYGGFFGMGFGTFIMFLLVTSGFSYMDGAATGRVIGFIMSLVAALVFAFHGLIHYSYGISMGLGCALGSYVGVHHAIKKGNQFIKTLFIIVMVITILKLLFQYLQLI